MLFTFRNIILIIKTIIVLRTCEASYCETTLKINEEAKKEIFDCNINSAKKVCGVINTYTGITNRTTGSYSINWPGQVDKQECAWLWLRMDCSVQVATNYCSNSEQTVYKLNYESRKDGKQDNCEKYPYGCRECVNQTELCKDTCEWKFKYNDEYKRHIYDCKIDSAKYFCANVTNEYRNILNASIDYSNDKQRCAAYWKEQYCLESIRLQYCSANDFLIYYHDKYDIIINDSKSVNCEAYPFGCNGCEFNEIKINNEFCVQPSQRCEWKLNYDFTASEKAFNCKIDSANYFCAKIFNSNERYRYQIKWSDDKQRCAANWMERDCLTKLSEDYCTVEEQIDFKKEYELQKNGIRFNCENFPYDSIGSKNKTELCKNNGQTVKKVAISFLFISIMIIISFSTCF